MSINYENRCKMFGQTIVACCRCKSCCATCCKTPLVSSTVSQILQSVVTELLRDTFTLCSRHLALRYLLSVFPASYSYTPSVCFLGTMYWHMFYKCYQQQLLRNVQCVFSVTCSHKSVNVRVGTLIVATIYLQLIQKNITSSVYDCTVEDVEYIYNKLSIHIQQQQYSHRLNLL